MPTINSIIASWPHWLKLLRGHGHDLYIILTPEQVHALTNHGVTSEEYVADEGDEIFRPIKWSEPERHGHLWNWFPAHAEEGEEIYRIKFPLPPPPVPSLLRGLPVQEPPWHVLPFEVCLVVEHDDEDPDDLFYMRTHRPPPGYPGHFWYHSGWTYNRGHSGTELAISLVSRATKNALHREKCALRNADYRRRKAQERLDSQEPQVDVDPFPSLLEFLEKEMT